MKTKFSGILAGVCLLLSGMVELRAQSPGLLISDERYQQLPLLPSYSGVKYTEIPARISLKKYCPVPGDQGKTGACVGWAVGYGALTIQRAVLNNTTEQAQITQQANSAAFLYNLIRKNKTDCSEGAYLEDCLSIVKDKGDCLERSFNYTDQDCAAQPGDKQYLEAKQYMVQDFAAVFSLDEEPKNKISKACKILATKTPMVVGMAVTPSFFEVLPGADTWNPAPAESISSYHAMVVVGYNSVEKYFDLLNSFGPSWGQNGFIRLPFDDFERLCRYAYVMVPAALPDNLSAATPLTPATNSSAVLGGEFVFRQPAGFVTNESDEEIMYFEEIQTKLTNAQYGLYEPINNQFKPGDVFQLVAREIPRGRYVYVFSQSPDGNINLHFPKKKTTMASAGFVLETTVEIVIPSEESMLQLPSVGDDYLCILYCHKPIDQFEQRIRQLESGNLSFPEKVQATFHDMLIKPANRQYQPDKMAFNALVNTTYGETATPIILHVHAK